MGSPHCHQIKKKQTNTKTSSCLCFACCRLSFGISFSQRTGCTWGARDGPPGDMFLPSSLEHQGLISLKESEKGTLQTDPHTVTKLAAWWPSYTLMGSQHDHYVPARRQHGQEVPERPTTSRHTAMDHRLAQVPSPNSTGPATIDRAESWHPAAVLGYRQGELPCIKIRDREYFSRNSCFQNGWVRTSKKLVLHKISENTGQKNYENELFQNCGN